MPDPLIALHYLRLNSPGPKFSLKFIKVSNTKLTRTNEIQLCPPYFNVLNRYIFFNYLLISKIVKKKNEYVRPIAIRISLYSLSKCKYKIVILYKLYPMENNLNNDEPISVNQPQRFLRFKC